MNLYDVIKKPVITEKSMVALEAGKYTSEVDTRAHKLLIKQAVEAAFEGVKVASVNTVTVKPKQKNLLIARDFLSFFLFLYFLFCLNKKIHLRWIFYQLS